MGMTCEQFWEQDCMLVVPYRKAYQIQQEQENRLAWLQGMYIYEALCDVAPVLHAFAKHGTTVRPYPDKPYEFESARKKTKEETNRQKMAKTANYLNTLAARFHQSFENKKMQGSAKPATAIQSPPGKE